MVANRNLRLLVVGQFISAIGDHFYLIAMPWLGLQLTGSALVAGTLLATASVPRSAFMLLGGAVTDRYSAKTLLILSNGLQAVLMLVLGSFVMVPLFRLWFLYVLVFLTGIIDAFGLPAFNALLPRIVDQHQLESGNIYLQGANMASGVIGPALAGLIISLFAANTASGSTLNGMGLVFLINAVTFFAGISLFWRIHIGDDFRPHQDSHESLINSIHYVIKYIRTEPQLSNLIGLMMVLGLFLTGTIRVGFPLIADTQLSGGARDFGYMTSAFGAGMLTGMIGVKLLPRPPQAISGLIVLSLFAFMPAGLILLGFTPPLEASLAIILVMGAAFGYVNIYLLSWLQRRTPSHLFGRIIAVVLFSTLGLSPISQVLMGYLLDQNLPATMIGVGSLVLILLIVIGVNRKMWSLQE
ncbi:MAG TPA: MFS transporter [Anaerolineales bacterium]